MTFVVAIREFVHLGHRVEGLPLADRQASGQAKKPRLLGVELVAAGELARDDEQRLGRRSTPGRYLCR